MTPGVHVLPGWYPLMRAAALQRAPIARTLAGDPLSLSRQAGGRIHAACALTGAPRPAAERDGWIFARTGADAGDLPACTPLIDGPSRQLILDGTVRAGLGDVGENILDTTHTSVVHEGYLRRPGARRAVTARVANGESWIAATYAPGAAPSGWGARLLGANRYTITDTFRAPSIAEVTYTDQSRRVFSARFWLTPISADQTYVAATLAVPGTGALSRLKLAALRVFFLRIFAEDRRILELIAVNRAAHADAPLTFAPQDILRPGINAILMGRPPLPAAPSVALQV